MPTTATTADAGMVMNHAITISFATLHRTAETRCPAPAPMMLDETTCVVDTGPPTSAAVEDDAMAEAVCEQKACTDRNRQIFDPMVLMIRQPPVAHPAAIAPAQPATTQKGISNEGKIPRMTRVMAMTPIDFWASFAPWLRARQMEETICILLKKVIGARASPAVFSAMKRVILKKSQPKNMPITGERISDAKTKMHPLPDDLVRAVGDEHRTDQPADQGVRRTRGQAEPPGDQIPGDGADQRRNDQTGGEGHRIRIKADVSMMFLPIVLATAVPKRKGPMNSQIAAMVSAFARRHGARDDDRRHDIRRIVEAVGEIEKERQGNHHNGHDQD